MNTRKDILLVDDEPELAFGASMWLHKAGYATRTEHDGRSGVAAVMNEVPDAIVMDVRMPELDGLSALKEIKQNEKTRRVPIVMLSASLIDQQVSLDCGASYFIKKPFCGKALVETVEAAIKEQANNDSSDSQSN